MDLWIKKKIVGIVENKTKKTENAECAGHLKKIKTFLQVQHVTFLHLKFSSLTTYVFGYLVAVTDLQAYTQTRFGKWFLSIDKGLKPVFLWKFECQNFDCVILLPFTTYWKLKTLGNEIRKNLNKPEFAIHFIIMNEVNFNLAWI